MIPALIRSALAWTFTVIYWPVFLTIHLLTFKSLPDDFVTGAIRRWGRTMLAILGIELELLNESTVDVPASRVVIVNHQSALDILWAAAVCPHRMLGIGKKEIIFVPIINLAWWGLDLIRIDRKNHAKALKALEGVAAEIRENRRSLFIAPEGTRTHDGKIGTFKKGAFQIARQAQVPIFPIVVAGAYELLPRTRYLPKRGRIRVRFLRPVSTEGLTHEDLEGYIAEIRAQMSQALDEMNKSLDSKD